LIYLHKIEYYKIEIGLIKYEGQRVRQVSKFAFLLQVIVYIRKAFIFFSLTRGKIPIPSGRK